MGTQLPSPKGHSPLPPKKILAMSVVVKRRMDQDAAWYGGSPQPRPHCVRWGLSSPSPKGHSLLQFSAHACCGEMTGWIKMPFRMELGLSPGHTVLDGDLPPGSSLPQRGTANSPPIFGPHLLWPNGCPSQLLLSTCLTY